MLPADSVESSEDSNELDENFGRLIRLPSEAAPQSILPDQLVHIPHVESLPAPTPPATSPGTEQEGVKREREALKEIRNVIKGICVVLAPRALLFLAIVGSLGLTVAALIVADWQHLLAAASFDVLVFWPTAFLYWKG